MSEEVEEPEELEDCPFCGVEVSSHDIFSCDNCGTEICSECNIDGVCFNCYEEQQALEDDEYQGDTGEMNS